MKKNLFLLFALALGVFVSLNSCGEKDACEDKDCGNGICVDGTCDCDAGYEYDADGNCNVETRAKLFGNYEVTETDPLCSNDPTPYLAKIETDAAGVTSIKITNFYASGDVVGTVSNDSKIAIASQDLGSDYTVSGNGTIETVSGKIQLTMNYNVKLKADGSELATCTNVIWVKQ